VLEALDKAISMPFKSIKLNTVIMRDFNKDEILQFVKLTKTMPIYLRFIEYMPFDGNSMWLLLCNTAAWLSLESTMPSYSVDIESCVLTVVGRRILFRQPME
jgi:molybdenum cofactor biosynthesis enzyme MoaA